MSREEVIKQQIDYLEGQIKYIRGQIDEIKSCDHAMSSIATFNVFPPRPRHKCRKCNAWLEK